MQKTQPPLPGVRFHSLTLVQHDIGRTPGGHIQSLWLCDCGELTKGAYSRVKTGKKHSCGCVARSDSSVRATTHGGKGTREYSSWTAMRRRCLIPEDKDYPRYGARGVTICEQWSDFAVFRNDMGPRPAGMTLDRIDTTGGYTPENTRWANALDQARNRRGSSVWHIKGLTFESITEAARHFNRSEQTIYRWAYGYYDPRRDTYRAPLKDCKAEGRY